jgi:hypothetical protein
MKLKPGVYLAGLKPRLILDIVRIDKLSLVLFGHDCTITSTTLGKHMYKSKHYTGDAFDIRLETKNNALFYCSIKKMLGRNYDVILETTHIHVEYDPKIRNNKRRA